MAPPVWVRVLALQTFNDQGTDFTVPICSVCNKTFQSLSRNQNLRNLTGILCHHAKIAGNIIRDFNNPVYMDGLLQLNENPQAEVENEGTKVRIIHEKSDKSTKSQHLAVVVQLC